MKKSPVSGISGSIRAKTLTKAQLIKQEKHGKRLDATSRGRAISTDPPVTTTGLDLLKLYRNHVSDAFVPKYKNIAKHIIIQFPKDLVDGEDAQFMLAHARRMVERIFGDQSIFADRIDRDEEGMHIVDVFVAPKYVKKTTHTSRLAVTLSIHEKALAAKYGRGNSVYDRGRAMQDSIHEYFRDEMNLPGVQRGNPKANPGSDWVAAEALRQQELEDKIAKADALLKKLEKQDRESAEQQARLAASQEEVRLAVQQAETDKARAASELAAAREDAANIRHDAEREGKREAAEVQKIRQQLGEALANVPQVQAEIADALEAAEAERFRTVDERRAIERLRAETEEENRRAGEQRVLDQRQHALLIRASNDEEGLNLRTKGEGFEMNAQAMSPDEKDAYGRPWSKTLITMARSIARMLERLREAARELLASRQAADRDMAEAKRREVEAEQRERQLTIDQKELAGQKLAFERDKASHHAKAEALREIEASIAEISDVAERWTKIIVLAVESPAMFDIAKTGVVSLSELGRKEASEPLRAFMQTTPPKWVPAAVKRLTTTFAALDQKTAVIDQETAKVAAKEAALTEMIARVGPILSPKQEEAVSEAKKVMRQFGTPPPSMER